MCDIDRAALDRLVTETPGITGSMADVSVAADVDLVFDDVRGCLGGLDVLINNAGIAGPTGPHRELRRRWLGAHRVGQPQQPVLLRPPRRAAAEGVDRQPAADRDELGGGAPGLRLPHAVRIHQVGHRGPHQVAGHGARSAGCARQRDPPRGGGGRTHGRRHRRARGRAWASASSRCARSTCARSRCGAWSAPSDVAAMALFLCSPAARNLSGQAISVDGNLEYL